MHRGPPDAADTQSATQERQHKAGEQRHAALTNHDIMLPPECCKERARVKTQPANPELTALSACALFGRLAEATGIDGQVDVGLPGQE